MQYARIINGTPVEIDQSKPLVINDIQYCLDIYSVWTPEALAEIGVYGIIEPDVPDGKRVAASSLTFSDGVVHRVVELEDVVQPVPQSITDRQFFQGLANQGLITQDEALDAVKIGAIPAALQVFVDAITSPDDRFAAKMLLSGAVTFHRSHPLTEAIREARGMTPQELDSLWTLWSQL